MASTSLLRDLKDALDEYIDGGEGGAQSFLDIIYQSGYTVVKTKVLNELVEKDKSSGKVEATDDKPTARRIKRKG